jgi:hypothetical protein
MGKRVLYYFWNAGNTSSSPFAVVQYTNGERRFWNDGDRGYEAAASKARRSKVTRKRAGKSVEDGH